MSRTRSAGVLPYGLTCAGRLAGAAVAALRFGVLAVLLLVAGVVGQLHAQTAIFNGEVLGGGLNYPDSVAVDASGNVYVSDNGNNEVKEIPVGCTSASCVITLGGGFARPWGIALDSSGNIYVADSDNSVVKRMPPGCASSSCVTALPQGGPPKDVVPGVAVDANGNVYFSVASFPRILEIPNGCTTSGCVTSLDGGFGSPAGIAVDAGGNVYVADTHAVMEMPAGCTTSNCTVTLGGGFQNPRDVAVDKNGNVYVADDGAGTIKRMPPGCVSQSCVTTVAGGLADPWAVAVDARGSLYVANGLANDVIEVPANGVNLGSEAVGQTTAPATLIFSFSTGGSGITASVVTQGATGLDFTDAGGGTCATNGRTHSYNAGDTCTVNVQFDPIAPGARYGAVQLSDAAGVIATAYIYGTGTGPQFGFAPPTVSTIGGGFSNPHGLAVDARGNVYVGDGGNTSVKKIPPGCTQSGCVVTLDNSFAADEGEAVDGAGNVYIAGAGTSTNQLDVIPSGCASSSCVIEVGGGFGFTAGVAVDGGGDVYLNPFESPNVRVIPPGCTSSSCVTTLGAGLTNPIGIAVDGSNNVYVADFTQKKVYQIPPGCKATACMTSLGGNFSGPFGLALDANGNIYVSDDTSGSLKEMPAGCTTSGCVTTLLSGLSSTEGVAVDVSGNIYVSDTEDGVVKELNVSTPPALGFPTSTPVNTEDSTDGPLSFTVENVGNAPLLFAAPLSGYNPSVAASFLWDSSSTCEQTPAGGTAFSLAPNASCTVAIDFEPASVGANAGSVALFDNSLNASAAIQSVGLSGTALANPLVVTTTSLPSVTDVGLGFSAPIQANGGVPPYKFSAANLPPGLSADPSSGTISGACTTAGIYSTVALSVTDSVNATASAGPFTIACNPALAFANTSPLPPVYVNQPISIQLTTNQIYATQVVFNLEKSSAGLKFSATGLVTGTAPATPGSLSLTIEAQDTVGGMAMGQFQIPVLGPPNYVVTTAADDATASASNCSNQNVQGATPDASCSLRDAIAAANNSLGSQAPSANITFSPTVFSTPQTITLNSALPNLASGTFNITGPGANLLSICGNNSTSVGTMLSINSGVTATLSGLTMTAGSANGNGGAINNNGTLTVTNSAFSGNKAQQGGVIYNVGTLTIASSVFSGNYASQYGGAVYSNVGALQGTLKISNSTFSSNSGKSGGGAINATGSLNLSYSTLSGNASLQGGAIVTFMGTISNSTFVSNAALGQGGAVWGSQALQFNNNIVSGNSSAQGAGVYFDTTSLQIPRGTSNLFDSNFDTNSGGVEDDCSGRCTPLTASIIGNPNLAPLGNYGGPTPTMIPLPGSAAICAGSAALIPSGVTTDQRGTGYPNTNTTYPGYNSTNACVDVGAVQTNYSIALTANPPATGTNPGVAMSPAPQVAVDESNSPLIAVPVSVGMTDANSDLTTTPAAASTSNGVATFGSLLFTGATTGDTLTATLPLNPTLTTPLMLATPASSSFSVSPARTGITGVNQTATFSADSQSVTLSATVNSNVEIVNGGTVTFTVLNGTNLVGTATISGTVSGGNASVSYTLPAGTAAGTYTVNAVYNPSTSFSGSSDSTHTLTIQQIATQVVVAGYRRVVYAGTLNGTAVIVEDAYGNTVSNYTGTATITTSDDLATVKTPVAILGGVGNLTVAFATTGTQSITATIPGLTSVSQTGIQVNPFPVWVVTTAADDAIANAINCTVQNAQGATPDASCSLRDAFAAADNVNEGTIKFSPAVFSTPQTLTLGSALPNLASGTFNIAGPGANLLSISGAGYTSLANPGASMLAIAPRVTATISGLTFTGGNSGGYGGAIYNNGSLTLNSDVFTGNSAQQQGGAVYSSSSAASVTVDNCSFSLNQALGGSGGAIYTATGPLVVNNSMFSGNTSATSGGALFSTYPAFTGQTSSLTVTNSTFSGNTAAPFSGGAIYIDGENAAVTDSTFSGNTAQGGGGAIYFNSASNTVTNNSFSGNQAKYAAGMYTGDANLNINFNLYYQNLDNQNSGNGGEDDCAGCAFSNTNAISGNPNLAPPGNYGGPTQTMIPLPGSAAICAGSAALIPSGVTTDQRGLGYPNTNTTYPGYNSTNACVDLGAVQTNYSIALTANPPATGTVPGTAMSPAPQATVDESGTPFIGAHVSVGMTDANSDLTARPATASTSNGVASFSSLLFTSATTGDTLTAILPLNPTLTTPLALATSPSSAFSVGPSTPVITWPIYGAITYGQPLSAASVLTPGSASFNGVPVPGNFAFTTLNTTPAVGTQFESITFTPNNTAAYNPVVSMIQVTVNAATPKVTFPTASAILYGQALSASTLSVTGSATNPYSGASITGTFTFANPSLVPTATGLQQVIFTPAATYGSAYVAISGSVSVTINPAPLASLAPGNGINFGNLYLGQTAIQTLTVSNVGTAAMTIKVPLITILPGTSGALSEFLVVNLCPSSLAAGKSCTITVTFVAGPFYTAQTVTLTISDNSTGGSQTVPITATVVDPIALLNATSLNFGTVKTGTASAAKSFVITNVGATSLSISAWSLTGSNAGDFSETNNCSAALAPQGSCTVSVVFKPGAKGSRSATLTLTDNAQIGTQSISLSGTGD